MIAVYDFSKVALGVGLDFVSGDNPDDDNYQAFNTLYATNHKFYGLMDYYLNIPLDTKGGGLQDYFLHLKLKAGKKTAINFVYHQFLLANDVYTSETPKTLLEKNLGGELDTYLGHKIASYATLNLGLSWYFPNATTEEIKGGSKDETNTWGWLMLSLNPELFNSKNKSDK